MEVLFNLHYSDVFAITNAKSNALFYQSYAKEPDSGAKKKQFSPQLFFTKDSEGTAEVKVGCYQNLIFPVML